MKAHLAEPGAAEIPPSTKTRDPEQLQRIVDQWNEEHPVGTTVRYWPVRGDDECDVTATRSEAWLLGGHTPVVMIDGRAGGVALDHCRPE
jgi:hypothetical protein